MFGAKADQTILRERDKNCVVEAVFSDFGQNEELILRRIVSPSGKSRSFLNDEPVSLNDLRELSFSLVDIHAQHQHLLLTDSGFQLSVLDAYAGNESLLGRYKECFDKVSSLEKELKELEEKVRKEKSQEEFNRFQYNRLVEASVKEGELEEMEEELRILSNAEEIQNSLLSAAELISPSSEEKSLIQSLKEAQGLITRIAENYKSARELCDRLESSRLELIDIEDELRRRAERITVSSEKLTSLEDRINLIYKLMNIHQVKSVESLIQIREEIEKSLQFTESVSQDLEKVRSELGEASTELVQLASELHERRVNHRKEFIKEITDEVRGLEMPHAVFVMEIEEREEFNSYGKDNIFYSFSANKNIEPRQLSKIASGGEISRIMLCLKSVLAKRRNMPAMILDEVDSGVSGSIADKMGDLIAELSKKMQIFAITHLPQIASKGNTHLLVFKEIDEKNTTKTKIREITDEERVLELARMLSGSETGEAAIANARELLGRNLMNNHK